MSETIENEKFVELNYKVIDVKTGDVLVTIDYPLGYVHGVNDVLSEQVEMNHWCLLIVLKMYRKNIGKSV
jgi:hypothetical protein